MNKGKRLTRKGPLVPARKRGAARGPRSTPGVEPAFLPFGKREQRDFESSPYPIRIFDRKTLRYLAVNDAALNLYGYTRAEFLALTPLNTRHPDERAEVPGSLDEPTGYLRHLPPRRHVTKSGEVIIVELIVQDITYRGREARLSLTMDVTKRVILEDMVRRREREFSALVENAPDIIARFDRDLRFIYVNPAVSDAMRIPRRAFLGRTSREVGVPESLATAWGEEIQRVFETSTERTLEFDCVCHDGTRCFEARLVPELGGDGAVDTVLSISRDITARKRAEDELKRQKRLLETVIENLPVGIFIKDAQTLRLVMRNPANRVRMRYSAKDIIGKTPHELYPKDLADFICGTDREVLETGRMVEIPEQEMVAPSGSVIVQHVRKVPVFDEKGEPWLLLGISDDVTERKRTERALRENEEFLRRVIESSRDCIKVLDLDGRITWINAGGQALMEADDTAALIGKSYLEFWSGSQRDAACGAMAAARAGQAGRFEGYCTSIKGTPKWWDEIVTPVLGPDGTPEKLLVVSRDITENKRAQTELQRQRNLLNAIIEHLPVGIVVKDARTLRYLLRNRMAEELTGMKSAEALGKRADEIYPPDLAAFIRESDQTALATGNAVPVSTEVFRYRTGRIVRNLKLPVPDEAGRYAYLVNMILDLTEIERAHAALRRSEERLRQLISMSPAAIFSFSLDPPLATTYISENVTAQVGWQPSDFTSSPSFWTDHVHPDDWATIAQAMAKLATDGRYSCEYRFHHKDGSWRWLREECQAVRDSEGTAREAIGIWMDITEQREAIEERVQRTIRQRDALVKEVHHRIKNHLQGIAGLLRQKAPLHPAVAPLLESVVAQMKSVALVYGLQNGADAPVAMEQVVDAICTSLEGLTPCRLLRKWDPRHASSLCLAGSGAVPVAVALNELVYNAIKHGERNAGIATIEVDYAEHGARAQVRIANRGGLPAGFDYASGAGCGTGLDLVRTLLDPEASTLAIWARGAEVETALTLTPPLVGVRSLQTAA